MAVFETLFILTGLRMGLCLGEEYCNKITVLRDKRRTGRKDAAVRPVP